MDNPTPEFSANKMRQRYGRKEACEIACMYALNNSGKNKQAEDFWRAVAKILGATFPDYLDKKGE